jgi:hypothetical protein
MWTDMATDPQMPFQVGRMVGAYKMASALLSREDNDTAQTVAVELDAAADWFLERGVPQSGPKTVSVRRTEPQSSEAATQVMPAVRSGEAQQP